MWRTQPLPPASNGGWLIPPALAASDAAVWLHGGVTPAGHQTNDLHKLDLATGRWSTIKTGGAAPEPLSGHTITYLRGRLLLLGAKSTFKPSPTALLPSSSDEPSAELWTLNLERPLPLRWQKHESPLPLARIEHCAAAHEATNTLLVAGGSAGSSGSLLDDVWRWDGLTAWADDHPASGWSRLSGGGSASVGGLQPAARRAHSCAVLQTASRPVLLMSGGIGASGTPLSTDEGGGVWSLDLTTHKWSQLPEAPTSGPQLMPPPIASCAERAARMTCEPQSEETLTGSVLTYSALSASWERIQLRSPSSSLNAKLAPSPCPELIMGGWARSVGPPHCDATSRMWLFGRRTGGNNAVELWQFAPGRSLTTSSGCVHGVVDPLSGTCVCEQGWDGADCTHELCEHGCGLHGTCDRKRHKCKCEAPWYGPRCEQRKCADECVAPHGTCDSSTGLCVCSPPWFGIACETAACPVCLGGGRCDNTTGCCICSPGFEGCDCSRPITGRWHQSLPPSSILPDATPALSMPPFAPFAPPPPPPLDLRPARRYAAACALCDGKPILYGGVLLGGASEPPITLAEDNSLSSSHPADASAASELSSQLWRATDPHEGYDSWERLVAMEDEYMRIPLARRAAASVSLGTDLVAMHGGLTSQDKGRANDELWLLKCGPVAHGAPPASWYMMRGAAAAPSARAHHSMVRMPSTVHTTNPAVLLYGGSSPPAGVPTGYTLAANSGDPTGDFHSDTWQLIVQSSGGAKYNARWVRLSEEGWAAPPARGGHAAASHAHGSCCASLGCMLIFGGLSSTHQPLSDLWQFCVSTGKWVELVPSAAAEAITRIGARNLWPTYLADAWPEVVWPTPRHQHSLTALAAAPSPHLAANSSAEPGALLLFGGIGGPTAVRDDGLWLYHLSRGVWLKVHTPAGDARPFARLGHSALALSPSTLYLYGGIGEGEAARGGGISLGASPVAAEEPWEFTLPTNLDDVVDACARCSQHGSCDLSDGRCVCEPPWGGKQCDSLQPEGVPLAPRRAISAALWLCGSLVVGTLVGWVCRQRAIKRELQDKKRAQARERRVKMMPPAVA